MKLSSVMMTVFSSLALAGCIETAEFGGSGGTGGFGGSGGTGGFGGSGGSSQAGERLARQVCTDTIRENGGRVVEIYRTRAVDYPSRGAGIDLYISTRRDPMTVSLSYTRCRFMYNTGRATLNALKRP